MCYDGLTFFHQALLVARRQTMGLVAAVDRRDHLHAWCESRELRRTLAQLEECAAAIYVLADKRDAMHHLHAVKALALPMLELAPSPSKIALRQAMSSNQEADRTQWYAEEKQWIAGLECLWQIKRYVNESLWSGEMHEARADLRDRVAS